MDLKNTLGGLAGACALTLLNEGVKRFDKEAPRLDLLGMNALAKLTQGNNIIPQTASKLLPVSMAGDLMTNSLYYAMADTGNKQSTLIRGGLLGLGAGLGAVVLPKTLGLEEDFTARTTETKILTVAWYIIGGLVAAAAINALRNLDTHD